MMRFVSASRTLSPTVGPNRSVYCLRGMTAISAARLLLGVGSGCRARACRRLAVLETALGQQAQRRRAGLRRVEPAVDQTVEAHHPSRAGEVDEGHLLGLARLEPHARAGGD